MCCHTPTDRLDKISKEPLNDLFDLIDLQQSPTTNDCTYIDPDSIDLQRQNDGNNCLTVLHINIHSIPSKLDELKELLSKLKQKNVTVDVILLCETFITDSNKDSCEIEGYKLFEEHRKNMTRGGVAIYVSKNLNFKDRSDLNVFQEGIFESCFVEITMKGKNVIIGEIYRVPGTNELDFIQKYENIITSVHRERKDIIIGTDQNLDFLKIHQHSNTAKFLDMNLSHDLLPSITKPTRITHRSCTLIDNIYVPCNLSKNFKSMILTTDISDHLPCLTILKSKKCFVDPITFEYRNLKKENITKISQELNTIDWNIIKNLDVNSGYNLLIQKITQIIDRICPKKVKTISHRQQIREPWMTKGLRQSSIKCDKQFKKICGLSKDDPKYLEYITFRNLYNKLKRKAKKDHYAEKISQYKNDSKKLWKILKEVSGKCNDKSSISDNFLIDGKLTNDPNVISNGLCKFYSNMGKNLAKKIPPPKTPFTQYLPEPCDSSIFLAPTSETEVIRIVNKLKSKSSSGLDGISNVLLKAIIKDISSPLTTIFNKSLNEGIFPEQMKIAKVTPQYKAKDKTLPVNYRPISLLPVISKILEKIVHKRMYSFLVKKLLLYDSQFGYRPNHSTTDAILEFVGRVIKGFERGENTLALFLDLSKAFDSIQHSTLLTKLENFGVRGPAYKWFESYLSNRKMYVDFKGNKSELQVLEFGVPQGSVLGPLLFILLTNDLAHSLQKCKSILFADDTTIYCTNKNVRVLTDSIKSDLAILVDWFHANKLSLNLNKTNFIFFQPKGTKKDNINVSLKVNDSTISRVDVVKFLGVYIDQNLTFDKHAKYVCSKLSKNLYMMRSVKNILSKSSLKLLYYSYIHSCMVYGLNIWGPLIAKSNLKRIRTIQKKALRTITHAKFNASTNAICKSLSILLVDELIEMELTNVSYRFVNKSLPKSVMQLFQANSYHHAYLTRQRDNPRIEKHKTAIFNKSFLCKAPSFWASLPQSNKTKNKKGVFKSCLKKHLLKKY